MHRRIFTAPITTISVGPPFVKYNADSGITMTPGPSKVKKMDSRDKEMGTFERNTIMMQIIVMMMKLLRDRNGSLRVTPLSFVSGK